MRAPAVRTVRVFASVPPLVALALSLAACGGGPAQGLRAGPVYPGLSCAPFARELSGIALHGDAASWWDQADGVYDRSAEPRTGAVLVLRREPRIPSGHVAVVSQVVAERRVLVINANWVPGELDQDQLVVDVSERGDWTAVRVWYPPVDALGAHTYPAYGFILPPAPVTHDALARGAEPAALRALAAHG